MRKKHIIVIVFFALIVLMLGISGLVLCRSTIISQSQKHYEAGERLCQAENYEKAISEYLKVQTWDKINYAKRNEKISECKTYNQSLECMKQAENFEENGDYKNALQMYKTIPEIDDKYYPKARQKINTLNQFFQTVKFLKKYIKSIQKKFEFRNDYIENIYYSEKNGFISDKEVVVKYRGISDKLYIVTKEKPEENQYVTVYEINKSPKYISVLGEVQQNTGWLSYGVNSVRKNTAQEFIENINLFDSKVDDKVLEYIKNYK